MADAAAVPDRPPTAREAVASATRSFHEARAKRSLAAVLSARLREIRSENHFAERMRLAFEGEDQP